MYFGLALTTLGIASRFLTHVASSPSPFNEYSGDVSGMYMNIPTNTITIKDEEYGIRNVSYWVDDYNDAVIDGDVIYGPVDDLLANEYTGEDDDEDETNIKRRAFSVFYRKGTWPGGRILYKYEDDATEELLSHIVQPAMKEWKRRAPYLDFRHLPNGRYTRMGVATITAKPCGGCNSHVGWEDSRNMRVNLQQSCGNSNGGCDYPEALHEIGHLLGLKHEHQRPDRGRYVRFLCQNIAPGCNNMPDGATCCGSFPSGCCKHKHNFDIVRSGFDSSGPYDWKSVMHYTGKAFALPGKYTIIPAVPGVRVPYDKIFKLSHLDVKRICKLYKGRGAECSLD
ncbi:hypothetical protein D9613_003383 [Agrocybe pediades]|uniref:Metalloendopeptidase n=1 Tax=Agrocybe pediades TaxID=84607 RepID=A0A8H4QPT0_9AGAR|nr:hypothetical protein D9613_003383 [Agrocybe pediades]